SLTRRTTSTTGVCRNAQPRAAGGFWVRAVAGWPTAKSRTSSAADRARARGRPGRGRWGVMAPLEEPGGLCRGVKAAARGAGTGRGFGASGGLTPAASGIERGACDVPPRAGGPVAPPVPAPRSATMSDNSRRQQVEEMLAADPDDSFLRYALAMEQQSAGE